MKKNIFEDKKKIKSKKRRKRLNRKYQAYSFEHQRQDEHLLPKTNVKDFACKIKYNVDDTLEIKEESIEDDGSLPSREINLGDNRKYQSIVLRSHLGKTKRKVQESNVKPEQKYTCEKCARTYKSKRSLCYHQKFGCDVTPAFICKFCERRFKMKCSMTRHISLVHLKTNSKPSQARFKCEKCCRSYTAKCSLTRHKRDHHETIGRRYTCDICGYKAVEKVHMSSHMIARHLK
ncbi:zinc finger protein 726-like [Belonocnema kinseyi]|uniref:zinc finger protein 726-like n=1 Tax=Belonocnema kinseyi TaxID=2817044 RepID=UPI00143CD2A7|nr:zinc finger protein 726-like [Belonocnema kinseyi]